jgi:hypothetical protein
LVELLGWALLGYGFGSRRKPGEIFGGVEERQLFVALFEDVDRADETWLVKEHARTVEQEPDDPHIDDDGDIDRLAEAGSGSFIVERVEQMNELMLFEFTIAAGPHLNRLSGWRGFGRSLDGGHRLCGLTGAGCESCTRS